jgi:hypothetical protein
MPEEKIVSRIQMPGSQDEVLEEGTMILRITTRSIVTMMRIWIPFQLVIDQIQSEQDQDLPLDLIVVLLAAKGTRNWIGTMKPRMKRKSLTMKTRVITTWKMTAMR